LSSVGPKLLGKKFFGCPTVFRAIRVVLLNMQKWDVR